MCSITIGKIRVQKRNCIDTMRFTIIRIILPTRHLETQGGATIVPEKMKPRLDGLIGSTGEIGGV